LGGGDTQRQRASTAEDHFGNWLKTHVKLALHKLQIELKGEKNEHRSNNGCVESEGRERE
jgi:hypothetical protein